MWEYKIEYIAIFPPQFPQEQGTWRQALLPKEERGRYGDFWWQKAVTEQLDKFGEQGWEVVSIPQKLIEGECLDGFVLLKRLNRKKQESHIYTI